MIINDNQRQSMIINDNQWYSRTTNDNQWQQTKHLSLQYFSPFLLSFRSRSIHSNSWKSLKNNHNLLIPMLKLEKLQGSDKPHGWWLGPGATWTSTTLLPACLPPPATRSRSHLLTSSLFQQGKTQHRKGKQELLTLWIEKGRIHGCAPIFLLLTGRRNLCGGKSRGSGFHWISPPCLCSRLLSGSQDQHQGSASAATRARSFVTGWHVTFQIWDLALPKFIKPFVLCFSEIQSFKWRVCPQMHPWDDWSIEFDLVESLFLGNHSFELKAPLEKLGYKMSRCCGLLFKLAEPDFPDWRLSDSEEYDDEE